MLGKFVATGVVAFGLAAGCGADMPVEGQPVEAGSMAEENGMNDSASEYVRLVLAVGEHDNGYVDAYYGPAEWREEIAAAPPSLDEIAARAAAARTGLAERGEAEGELEGLRHRYLDRQLAALEARVSMLQGEAFSFDEESSRLYDAVAPRHDKAYFEDVVAHLEELLPGGGSLEERYNAFREAYVIPEDKLDAVFSAAIEECRRRTLEHLELPSDESFRVEYVTDQPWSGYNWFQGGHESLIQVNIEFPIQLDRAIDLACHEGYPGHHTYNALLEWRLVEERGWVEYSVYPLYSPQSLIAEGSANYGIDMAFPGDERARFDADVLAPLAGIDPETVPLYYEVLEAASGLDYAGNEAARSYLDGEIDAEEAAEWLVRYALSSPERAAQRVRFFDTYRSYVINYNLGKDMVRDWIERGDPSDEERWRRFTQLLSTPRLPSDLQ